MRKALFVLFMLVLVGLITSCGDAGDRAGIYTLKSMTTKGETCKIADNGAPSLTLNKNYTGSINLYNDVQDIEWDKSNITIYGESVSYKYKDGTITLVQDNDKLVFEKK